jgi:hypothetical protein
MFETAYPGTKHRPAPLQLPADPRAAAALCLAVVKGDDYFRRAEAVEGLSARIAKLSDAGSDQSLEELTAHLPILEALFLRFTTDAISSTSTSGKSALIRMALAAQTSYSRTVALVAGLKLQREGKAVVAMESLGAES